MNSGDSKIVEFVQKADKFVRWLRENGAISQVSSISVQNEHVIEGIIITLGSAGALQGVH